MNSENSLDNSQPAGISPAPDLPTLSKEEIKGSRKTVKRLGDLLGLAEKGDENAVPDIRRILNEYPDLAWHFVDVAQAAEDTLIAEMTREADLATKEVMRWESKTPAW